MKNNCIVGPSNNSINIQLPITFNNNIMEKNNLLGINNQHINILNFSINTIHHIKYV